MLIGFAYAHFYDMTHWKGSISLRVWVDNLNSSFKSRVKGYSLFHSPASIQNAEQSLERDRVRFVEYLTRSSWGTPSIYSWHVISWLWLLAIDISAVLSLHIAFMEDTMHWFPKYCSWVAAKSFIGLMFFIGKWTHWYLAMGGIARKIEEICNNRDLEKSGEAWPELEWWEEALLGDAQNDLITDEKTMSTEKSRPHLTVTSTSSLLLIGGHWLTGIPDWPNRGSHPTPHKPLECQGCTTATSANETALFIQGSLEIIQYFQHSTAQTS
ncbi:hypothetical protein BKA61DRAFT_704263 [Leptodontidium sp. MPI-SDFR-AT-0119]|nr:hypothetical protein BKA61DRAFT_704263 [Leptodontidium sp. MPI-SDFR-AT-0119]